LSYFFPWENPFHLAMFIFSRRKCSSHGHS
jgi:hypothetical protein